MTSLFLFIHATLGWASCEMGVNIRQQLYVAKSCTHLAKVCETPAYSAKDRSLNLPRKTVNRIEIFEEGNI